MKGLGRRGRGVPRASWLDAYSWYLLKVVPLPELGGEKF